MSAHYQPETQACAQFRFDLQLDFHLGNKIYDVIWFLHQINIYLLLIKGHSTVLELAPRGECVRRAGTIAEAATRAARCQLGDAVQVVAVKRQDKVPRPKGTPVSYFESKNKIFKCAIPQ